jgi:hypothetical protein
MSRMCYTPATTGTPLANREDYALAEANKDASTLNVAVKLLANETTRRQPKSIIEALEFHRSRVQDGAK